MYLNNHFWSLAGYSFRVTCSDSFSISDMVPKIRTKQCESCKNVHAKYTCPKCSAYSCCLACVHKHKTKRFCSGVRDKFSSMKLSKMTSRDVFNDYR